VEKAGFAVGPLIIGLLLSAAGYDGSRAASGTSAMNSDQTFAVYLGVAIIPAIATCLCVLVLRGYHLTEQTLKAIEPPAA